LAGPGPGPCPRPLPAAASAAGGRQGWAPPHPPTYRAGAPAPRVREMGLGRTHFWERWPLPLGAGERILRGRWKEGSGEDRAPRRSKRRRKERGGRACRAAVPSRWKQPEPPPPGFHRALPRPGPRRPCSCALAQGIGRHRLPGPAKGGSCGWRDTVLTPASSSARPAARSAPLCCGGGRGTQRPGLAAQAAAAASSLPPATSSLEVGYPGHPIFSPAAPPRRGARAASAGLGPL
jgi:hypothetical protein